MLHSCAHAVDDSATFLQAAARVWLAYRALYNEREDLWSIQGAATQRQSLMKGAATRSSLSDPTLSLSPPPPCFYPLLPLYPLRFPKSPLRVELSI